MKYTNRKIQKIIMIIQVSTIQLFQILTFCLSLIFCKEINILDIVRVEILFKPFPNRIPKCLPEGNR